jgi:hypothetical protein
MADGSHLTRNFLLLAPALTLVPPAFPKAVLDEKDYAEHLARLQRLRGRIYLDDGAIEHWQLSKDGRHCLDTDEKSWHLLSLEGEEVLGCARLQLYPETSVFSELGVARSAQAHCPVWGSVMQRAVTAELHRAQDEQLSFIEAGGWALTPELRCTTEALNIALGSYALGQLLGGCLGLSTATVRYQSASILRRLGGSALLWEGQSLPPYYDPEYQCQMEVVLFDSRRPNPKYQFRVDQLQAELPLARVLCAKEGVKQPTPCLVSLANATSSVFALEHYGMFQQEVKRK